MSNEEVSAVPSAHVAWLDQHAEWNPESVTEQELARLAPVGKRPSLAAYTRELWQRRHFIWADARAKALSSQRGTFLGNVWLVVKPMLDASVFFVMFGLLLQTSRGIENYIGYLVIGVTLFPPMQAAVSTGATVMQSGKNLIRGFSFPRAALPIAYTIRSAINLLPPFIAIVMLMIAMPPHVLPSWHWLFAAPIFILQQLLCLGLTFISSRITTILPDMRNIWPFLTQFWFYGSGVFYSYERFIDHPVILQVMDVNPGYLVLTMYRNSLLYNTVPDMRSWTLLLTWAIGLSIAGYIFFWQKEETYGVER